MRRSDIDHWQLATKGVELAMSRKPHGISVIVSCQDDEHTLTQCVESFRTLADEIIISTNNAEPGTLELANKLAHRYEPVVRHVTADHAVDLPGNRQAGYEESRFFWVMRCDADYIAYTDEDGSRSISELREWLMNWRPVWPTAIFFRKVSLAMRWDLTYQGVDQERSPLHYIPRTFSGRYQARIYSSNPFLRFERLGRWEGVPYMKLYRKRYLERPFWFEVTMKSEKALFFRKARTDWRERGYPKEYPTLEDYVRGEVLPTEYPDADIDLAAHRYVSEEILPRLTKYEEDRYFPLPSAIKFEIERLRG